jgi:hypothetical protein
VLEKVRNVSFVLGLIMWYLAVSTSDYYVMEAHEPEPASVTVMLIGGAILLLPAALHIISQELKGGRSA